MNDYYCNFYAHPIVFIGMEVDGATMGTGAAARRFAGQDGASVDAVSDKLEP